MTAILRRVLSPEAAAKLGIGLALVAAEVASEEAGCEVGVKWPNDLLLEGKKLGGVLVETEVSGGRVAVALVSLGLNVNVPENGFPLELRGSAVSLLSATGKEYQLARLSARILERFEGLMDAILGDADALVAVWRGRDVLLGRQVRVEVAGETMCGRTRGIDCQGRLLLSTGWLRRTAIPAGEVTSVREIR
jgi:BirA family biotin operon repressor/biotin-[acetyl-CoA-carboxylase] ligase